MNEKHNEKIASKKHIICVIYCFAADRNWYFFEATKY